MAEEKQPKVGVSDEERKKEAAQDTVGSEGGASPVGSPRRLEREQTRPVKADSDVDHNPFVKRHREDAP